MKTLIAKRQITARQVAGSDLAMHALPAEADAAINMASGCAVWILGRNLGRLKGEPLISPAQAADTPPM
jgi:hypothetical protein